jgi:hypothetical protein
MDSEGFHRAFSFHTQYSFDLELPQVAFNRQCLGVVVSSGTLPPTDNISVVYSIVGVAFLVPSEHSEEDSEPSDFRVGTVLVSVVTSAIVFSGAYSNLTSAISRALV